MVPKSQLCKFNKSNVSKGDFANWLFSQTPNSVLGLLLYIYMNLAYPKENVLHFRQIPAIIVLRYGAAAAPCSSA